MTRALAAALAALATGCATLATDPAEEIAGIYESGFEVDAFRPCNEDEAWWVAEGEELRRRYRETVTRDYQPVYVVVRGEVGPRGAFGHMGAYDRELRVREVVELDGTAAC